jgi:hypothetical protein
MADPAVERITRDDLEAKLRAIKGEFDERAAAAKATATPYIAAGAILLLLIAYLLGKRVGKRKSTVVEIRRI